MPLTIDGKTLQRIAVVDDDKVVRASYAESLEDLDVVPVDVDALHGDVRTAWDAALQGCDAVVTDLVLKRSGYASFNGGELAAECRRRDVPAILCTSYTDVNQELPRSERRHVAAILRQANFDHSPIHEGFKRSIAEIRGDYMPERRPWRTQVEIVDVPAGGDYVWVIVMGRSANERVKIFRSELPDDIESQVSVGKILHAVVNTGAKSAEDLYFDDWEPK